VIAYAQERSSGNENRKEGEVTKEDAKAFFREKQEGGEKGKRQNFTYHVRTLRHTTKHSGRRRLEKEGKNMSNQNVELSRKKAFAYSR